MVEYCVTLSRYLDRPEDSEGTFSVFESNCHLLQDYQANHSKVEAINPVKYLAQGQTRTYRRSYPHTIHLILNVKHKGHCKYQRLTKSFGQTQQGYRTQVYRLRGGCSNY